MAKRKSKLKERIRAIAYELLATAAERALRSARLSSLTRRLMPSFVDRFPYQETGRSAAGYNRSA